MPDELIEVPVKLSPVKAEFLDPFVFTLAATKGTTARNLFDMFGKSNKLFSLTVTYRTKGAGTTYVALGSHNSREIRLKAEGDKYTWTAPVGYYLEGNDITAVADHVDGGTLEVSGIRAGV